MRIGTLFSGIGSPEQGAKRVYDNLELIFACEWDKFARESFKANYDIADEHFHKDINDMDGTQYKGEVDIIVGGSPCQDFSIAGLRAGVDGQRGQLIWQYFRIIKEVEPLIFIYENVKGMVSDKGGKTLNDFLEVFRSIGYSCHFEVLNTKDYGVPQNRERVFIVGFKDMEHYYRFGFADKVPLKKRLKDLLEDEVDEKYYLNKPFEEYNQDSQGNKLICVDDSCNTLMAGTHGYSQGYIADLNRINRTLRCGGGNSLSDKHCFDLIAEPQLNQVGILDIKGNDSIKRVYATDGISPTLTTMGGGNREPKIQVPSATSKGYEEATLGDSINLTHPNSTTRRGRVGKQVAQTLDCACNQAVVTERIRKLTPRECFRLQDFPDTFRFTVSNSQLYKQAGNSISVNVIEMIFRQIEKSRFENCDKSSLF